MTTIKKKKKEKFPAATEATAGTRNGQVVTTSNATVTPRGEILAFMLQFQN